MPGVKRSNPEKWPGGDPPTLQALAVKGCWNRRDSSCYTNGHAAPSPDTEAREGLLLRAMHGLLRCGSGHGVFTLATHPIWRAVSNRPTAAVRGSFIPSRSGARRRIRPAGWPARMPASSTSAQEVLSANPRSRARTRRIEDPVGANAGCPSLGLLSLGQARESDSHAGRRAKPRHPRWRHASDRARNAPSPHSLNTPLPPNWHNAFRDRPDGPSTRRKTTWNGLPPDNSTMASTNAWRCAGSPACAANRARSIPAPRRPGARR